MNGSEAGKRKKVKAASFSLNSGHVWMRDLGYDMMGCNVS
jgi:hypothetical protein